MARVASPEALDGELVVLAQRYARAGGVLYATALPLDLLSVYLPVPDPDRPFEGNRRVSRRHAIAFAEYWLVNEQWIAPPLLLDTPLELDEYFTPIAGSADIVAGELRIPHPTRSGLEILDGQHRVLGWALLVERLINASRTAGLEMERAVQEGETRAFREPMERLDEARAQQHRMRRERVTLEILQGIRLDDHKQYFFDIAANARGISKSLSAGFDKREALHRVAKTLCDEHPLLRERVDFENDRVGGKDGMLFSLRNVVDVVAATVLGANGWITRANAKHLSDANVRDIAEQALDALVGCFDPLMDVAEDTISPGQLRRESLLGSVTMLRALAAAYHSIAVRQGKVTPEADALARRVFGMLAPEMGLPISDLWWASRSFSDRDARAPGARRQDLQNLVDLIVRIGHEVAQHAPEPAPIVLRPQPQTEAAPGGRTSRRELRFRPEVMPPAVRGSAAPRRKHSAGLARPEDDGPLPRLTGPGASTNPSDDYFRQIGRTKLLTAEQEVELAKRIEAGVLAQEALDRRIDERRLRRDLEWLVRDGQSARDQMIEANLRLVVSIVKRYLGQGLEFLDLIQEGTIGLIRAVEKFDFTAGFKFSTYATWWIRQSATRALADQGRLVRLPVHMVEKVNKVLRPVHQVQEEWLATAAKVPSLDELAEATGFPAEDVEEALRYSRPVWSLDEPIAAVGDEWRDGEWDGDRWVLPLGHVIQDSAPEDLLDVVQSELLHEELGQVLDTLSEREAGVISGRFGLSDGRPKTLDEIGKVYGVTRERIRQIETKTMSKLRHPSRSDFLMHHLDLPDESLEQRRRERAAREAELDDEDEEAGFG